jgi:putative hydrolase
MKLRAEGIDTSDNAQVAAVLREIASSLRVQGANLFRIRAYERAAGTIEEMQEGAAELVSHGGSEALLSLPGIGRGLASTIAEIVRSGRSTQLDRLRGESDPEGLLMTVPGIGSILARSIHEELHIDSLEELELAAHDGRLESLPGIGPRRVAAICANVAAQLARRPRSAPAGPVPVSNRPSIALLMEMDRRYRESAQSEDLERIAPHRFNPRHEAWLPVMHSDSDGWHCTVLYSNTERAHRLGRTHDWVVIYCYDDEHRETQQTVVTETHGPLAGRRVVRGREDECRSYYEDTER